MRRNSRRIASGGRRLRELARVLAALALAGCATTHPLMPTPELYVGPQARPLFTGANPEVRTPPLDLLFITDRAPARDQERPDSEPYTAARSRSMAFGSVTVTFGEGVAWDELVRQSTVARRTSPIELKLGPTRELGRFPGIPYSVTATPSGLKRTPAALEGHDTASRAMRDEVARRLALSPRREFVLYVHGYDNTFGDAAMTMGELCHFLGREFACGIFTWPAGGEGGVLAGYNVDYESSVFATEHLRKTIRAIAGTPGLAKLHLLAHSRGTDVLVTALSDLNYEAYTQQSNLARRYKVGNVVLMAPDIDADVFVAKLFKALSDPDMPYGPAPDPRMVLEQTPEFRITVYVSPDDKALAASSWLFGSLARLGRIDKAMVTPEQVAQLRMVGIFDVIEVRGTTDRFGHGYFTSNPRVSADLIALLRYGLGPDDPGRPLEVIEKPFWRVPAEPRTAVAEQR